MKKIVMSAVSFAHLIEGGRHKPHGPQIHVGWLAHSTGVFYPWDEPPDDPVGFSPVYIDRD